MALTAEAIKVKGEPNQFTQAHANTAGFYDWLTTPSLTCKKKEPAVAMAPNQLAAGAAVPGAPYNPDAPPGFPGSPHPAPAPPVVVAAPVAPVVAPVAAPAPKVTSPSSTKGAKQIADANRAADLIKKAAVKDIATADKTKEAGDKADAKKD